MVTPGLVPTNWSCIEVAPKGADSNLGTELDWSSNFRLSNLSMQIAQKSRVGSLVVPLPFAKVLRHAVG